MANSATIRVSIFILLILFAQEIDSIEITFRGPESMQKRSIDGRRILRESGFDFSKTKHRKQRIMADTDRVAPGGPDPQHH